MQELIKVTYDNDRPTVSGRELHQFLGVQDHYTDWIKRMIAYGFVDGVDYIGLSEKSEKPLGGRPSIDHQLTIEMAKEIAMLQRNERGKQARQYFIQLEKDWNSPEKVMARALKIAEMQIKSLTEAVNHKQKVIEGFTEGISLDQKRQILNMVMRKGFSGADGQRDRWAQLYRQFEIIHHVDIERRITSWQVSHCKPWTKPKLEFVDKQMGMLDELYAVAVKLYETDVRAVQLELFGRVA